MMPDVVRLRLTQIVLWTGIIATLTIAPFTNFDPISLPKMTAIAVGAFSCFFLMLIYLRDFVNSHRKLILLSSLFVLFMGTTIVFSKAPLEQQLWGMFGRNTGFVAYLSLIFILFASCIGASKNFDFPRRLAFSVIGVSIFETFYCLIQIAKRDPVPWSEMQPFGTLGNVNFLSAFLGLSTVMILSVIISKYTEKRFRFFLGLLLITQLSIIVETGSIQGLMMFGVGTAVTLFFWSNSTAHRMKIQSIIFAIYGSVGILSIFALFNQGPLARFIFQPSITFRWDYMHAGVEMTSRFPWFGVGLDSYGDWYRTLRGEISTLRTGPDRTANSAHNIFLDISSNGGFPLILTYLILVFWAAVGCYKLWKSSKQIFNSWEAALVSAWIAYQIQALISINQLGVGIWAWILTGALIAYSSTKFHTSQNLSSVSYESSNTSRRMKVSDNAKRLKGELIPAKANLLGFAGAVSGLIVCLPALSADSKVYDAIKSNNMVNMIDSLKGSGVTAWHMAIVLDQAVKNNDSAAGQEVIKLLNLKFPRDYYSYFIRFASATVSLEERDQARLVLKELDPFNPNIP
jgi:hypothetical protein